MRVTPLIYVKTQKNSPAERIRRAVGSCLTGGHEGLENGA